MAEKYSLNRTGENRYYVYEWFNKETGEVFYVGKGTKDRYKVINGRNNYFTNYYNKYDCDVRITKFNIAEEVAYSLEINTIRHYREIGECKCNFDNGGSGGHESRTPEDTTRLKQINWLVRSSKFMIDSNSNIPYEPTHAQSRSVAHAMEVMDIYTIYDFMELTRKEKLEFCDYYDDNMEEEDYNSFVCELVEDGEYSSFDNFWEQQYKY